MTQLRAAATTDVGRHRQINQDMPLVDDADGLWAVADGMGGHRGGEVASDLAVQALRDTYAGGEHTLEALLDAAAAANAAVNDAADENPELRGMGTTLVAIAHTDDDELAYVSVGDSRIYLFRSGELTRLTVDHSLVEELVREGSITPEEARTHPKRNIVTRALGIDQWVKLDSDTIVPYVGDRFLLCSDGLFNEVEEDKIASVLRRLAGADDAAAELVRLANEGGGRDNITVLVLDVIDDDGRAERASAAIGAGSGSAPTDLAGFSTAGDHDDVAAEPAPRASRRARRAAGEKPPRRFTWRVLAFLVLLAVVLAASAGAIGFYARGTYFVGFDGDTVAVFQGKPGGVLWFEPTLVERTTFTRADVRPELRDQLDEGVEISDRTAALTYPASVTIPSTTTTTTAPPTTTTTAPPVVPAPPP